MKHTFTSFLLLFATVLLLVTGCKPDPGPMGEGTVEFKVVPTFNGGAFTFNTALEGRDGRNYQLNFLRYFLSNIYLVKADYSREKISDVMLVNEEDAGTRVVSAKVPAGDYVAVSFGIGLDEARNGMDPSTFNFEDPQGDLSMYWTWATKYIFVKYEGFADTTGTTGALDKGYFFHVGGDAFYRLVQRNMTISITDGQTTTVEVPVDYDRMINGVADYIDVKTDDGTHTMDNIPLAERLMGNVEAAFNE